MRILGPGPLLVGLTTALALLLGTSPAEAQSACGPFHRIETGETLLEIAQSCGVTLPALVAANPGVRGPRDFEVGDRLRIPDPSDPQPTPVEACGPYYTVRTGDSLTGIAQTCGLTVALIVAANPPLPRPLGNFPGRRLRIPPLPVTAVRDPATVAVPVAGPAPDSAAEPVADTTTPPELTRLEGVLQRGQPCPRLRADDGSVVAIRGEVSQAFEPGDRVVLMGLPLETSSCGATPTLDLRILYKP